MSKVRLEIIEIEARGEKRRLGKQRNCFFVLPFVRICAADGVKHSNRGERKYNRQAKVSISPYRG